MNSSFSLPTQGQRGSAQRTETRNPPEMKPTCLYAGPGEEVHPHCTLASPLPRLIISLLRNMHTCFVPFISLSIIFSFLGLLHFSLRSQNDNHSSSSAPPRVAQSLQKIENNSLGAAWHDIDPGSRAVFCFPWRMQTVDEEKTQVPCVKTQTEDDFRLLCPAVTAVSRGLMVQTTIGWPSFRTHTDTPQHQTRWALPERMFQLFTSNALSEITLCGLKIEKPK